MEKFLPYGRQEISEEDIRAVTEVLKSDWLTTGPMVPKFEAAFSEFTKAPHSVAVSSGTAALHAAMFALDIKAGDEVIVPSLTFAATANAVVYQGGTPVFTEIKPADLLIDPNDVEKRITKRTKAIVAVDYAGNPCDYDSLKSIASKHGVALVADACHAIGGNYHGKPVGTLADISCFSFHPVKHITTAEGGMVTAMKEEYAARAKLFRNHGITTDHRERSEKGLLNYEMVELGFNYRLNDILCALGLSQLSKLKEWVARRNEIAKKYRELFRGNELISCLAECPGVYNAYHLFVVKVDFARAAITREKLYLKLKENKIGMSFHYPLVHLHPYYRKKFQTKEGALPITEAENSKIISLPMYPGLTNQDVSRISEVLINLLNQNG